MDCLDDDSPSSACPVGRRRWVFNFQEWQPDDATWLRCMALLQPDERERIGKFRRGAGIVGRLNPEAKSSCIGQLLIQKLGSGDCGVPRDQVRIARSKTGKPFLDVSAVPSASPLLRTIVATDPSVATPVSAAEQIKTIQAEKDAYAEQ